MYLYQCCLHFYRISFCLPLKTHLHIVKLNNMTRYITIIVSRGATVIGDSKADLCMTKVFEKTYLYLICVKVPSIIHWQTIRTFFLPNNALIGAQCQVLICSLRDVEAAWDCDAGATKAHYALGQRHCPCPTDNTWGAKGCIASYLWPSSFWKSR